jgi:hypothetical protein
LESHENTINRTPGDGRVEPGPDGRAIPRSNATAQATPTARGH